MNIDEWDKDKTYIYYNERFKTLWLCFRVKEYDHLNMVLFARLASKTKIKCEMVNIDYIESLHYVELGEL